MADAASAQARDGTTIALDLSVAAYREHGTDPTSAVKAYAEALKAYELAASTQPLAPVVVIILPARPMVVQSSRLLARHRAAELFL